MAKGILKNGHLNLAVKPSSGTIAIVCGVKALVAELVKILTGNY